VVVVQLVVLVEVAFLVVLVSQEMLVDFLQ
jgi:hypothetical protein